MTSTTDTHHPSGDQDNNLPPKTRLASSFNNSAKALEVEMKRLVKDDDRSVFEKIERFFVEKNMIKLAAKGILLQTRQLDTMNFDLHEKGKSIRVRGDCPTGDLNFIQSPDICVKDGKTRTDSGAVKRNEYEARINSFEEIEIAPLLEKYPKEQFPDLHETLNNIHPEDLREHFRIDCLRTRYIIQLPEEITGIKDKNIVFEAICDQVAFMMDIEGRDQPLLFRRDFEFEAEVLFKPCAYDKNPEEAKKYVSSPDLTKGEIDKGFAALDKLLEEVCGNSLKYNDESKAERGFKALQETLKDIGSYVSNNSTEKPSANITSAYRIDFNQASQITAQKLHRFLKNDLSSEFKQRPFAQRLVMP
jgi:hypothetical protein